MTAHEDDGHWTLMALKEHIEKMLTEIDRRYMDRFTSQESNVGKALAASDKRLDGMNEFRDALNDQQAKFMDKGEYERAHRDLIERMEESLKTLNARVDQSVKTLEGQILALQAQVNAVSAAVT